ncbi:Cyanophycinase [Flavobacteriaceae bacterium 3519-10]|nr:Cyanophycinase [Flavobacteriaceae bacterium 3519-10]
MNLSKTTPLKRQAYFKKLNSRSMVNIKGKVLVIGGAEDKNGNSDRFSNTTILERFIDETRQKKRSRIEIITSASSIPEEVGKDYLKIFKKLGAENCGALIMRTRQEADDPANIERLKKADAVYATGGSQLALTSTLGGTEFYKLLTEKLQEPDFVYAGTSAGAAAASESMIIQGGSTEAAYKGEVTTATGLGLVKDIVFDTHFIERGRIARLFEVVVSNPAVLGVGLEENTALLIHRNKMEAVGTGMGILLDGRRITNSNLLEVVEGAPLSIENMTLHLMSEHDIFDLKDMKLKILNPPEAEV